MYSISETHRFMDLSVLKSLKCLPILLHFHQNHPSRPSLFDLQMRRFQQELHLMCQVMNHHRFLKTLKSSHIQCSVFVNQSETYHVCNFFCWFYQVQNCLTLRTWWRHDVHLFSSVTVKNVQLLFHFSTRRPTPWPSAIINETELHEKFHSVLFISFITQTSRYKLKICTQFMYTSSIII